MPSAQQPKTMTFNNKLSIITVNLNDKNGLTATFESVFQQTFTDFEYIVIDGNSTDGSKEVIEAHKKELNYSVSEPDTGVYNAMNKGIARCRAEYCLFLNSGDVLYNKDSLKNVFSSKPTEDIIYGNSLNGDIFSTYPEKITPLYLFRKPVLHQASFIKRELFSKLGFYNESYKIVADWEFYLKAFLAEKCSYKYIDTPIARFDMEGLSNQNSDLLEKERTNMLKEFFKDRYEEYSVYSEMQDELIKVKKKYNDIKNYPYSASYRLGNTILSPIKLLASIFK